MKYMLLIGGAEDAWDHLSEAEQGALYAQIGAWWGEHAASGEILEGHQLQSAATATTVRRDPAGAASITDGPFVEGKEMVGGYGILEVPDLDAAIRLASSWPGPDVLEIRPIVVREE